MTTLYPNMGLSDPGRQKPHMNAIREKGKDRTNQENLTATIGQLKQYDQDNIIQRRRKEHRTQNASTQAMRQEPAASPKKEQQDRRRKKRKALIENGTDSEGAKKEKSKKNNLYMAKNAWR